MLDLFMLALVMTAGLIALAKLKLSIHRRSIERRLRSGGSESKRANGRR